MDYYIHVLFCVLKEVVHMESDWDWINSKNKINRKEGEKYEIW